MERKYVIFQLNNERYGVPIDEVERIIAAVPPTKLPRAPKALLGVFELRGQTIPIMDGRLRFDLPESKDCRNYVIVFTPHGRCALRVDLVAGIISLEDKDIDPNPEMFARENDDFVAGIARQGETLTLLLDLEHLVPKELAKGVSTVNTGPIETKPRRGANLEVAAA